MSQKQVVVEISPSGQVKLDAQGYRGNECDKATQHIEQVLGGEAKKSRKPEFHMPSSQSGKGNLKF